MAGPRTKLSEPDGSHRSGSVAFLFLGELFLIPHLLPIAIALARRRSPPLITLFVITSAHEEIIAEALAHLGITNVSIRRAHGFRTMPVGFRDTPDLSFKPLLLAANAWAIMHHDVVVVAERTSLWLPRVVQRGAAFIYNEHGAGPHANFTSVRNRYAARILMPGQGMAERVRESGHSDAPIEIVGYIKRDYIRQLSKFTAVPPFAEARTTVVYVPHWLERKSSWWAMGEQILAYFAQSTTYNLIVAPHIRLPEKDPDFERKVRPYRGFPNIQIDATSFRLVDQSYINGGDIYLGDGSSQVVEFAERPRPVIFLNPMGIAWRSDPRFGHWCMGEVVVDIPALDTALANAAQDLPRYAAVQTAYVARMMGDDDGQASDRATDIVLEVLASRRPGRPPIADRAFKAQMVE